MTSVPGLTDPAPLVNDLVPPPPCWDPQDQDALTALMAERLAGDLPDANSPDGERLADAERRLLRALHTTRRLRRLRAAGLSDHEAHLSLQLLDDGSGLRAERARRILEG